MTATPETTGAQRRRATELPADDPRHGTENGYCNLKCRCDRCRAAWAIAAARRRRARLTRLAPDDPRHGKASTYLNHACRCQPCTAAATIARYRTAVAAMAGN